MKLLSLFPHNISKKAAILVVTSFLLSSFDVCAQNVTRLITDYNGYWSSTNSSNTVRPNNRHNVLGFQLGTTIYSTGVNDAILSTNSVAFTPAEFKNMPLATMPGSTGTGSNYYIILGKSVDGSPTSALLSAVNTLTTKAVLTDGINGLDIGTGVTNVNAGINIQFNITCINPSAVTDNIPDFLFTQVADPSNTGYDVLTFRNSSGAQVGNAFNLRFDTYPSVGKYDIDLFTLPNNAPYNTATPIATGSAGTGDRDIRLLALKFSDLGLTEALASQVTSIRIATGGNADPAFYAYNTQSVNFDSNNIWTGRTDSNWNNTSNWVCGTVPTSTSNVIIPTLTSGSLPVVDGINAQVNNLTIASGQNITLSNNGNLIVNGSVNNSGHINAENGKFTMNGATPLIINNGFFTNNNIRSLEMNTPASITLGTPLNLYGLLQVNGGSFTTGNQLLLKSNASGTAMVAPVAGTISGNVQVEKYIPARRAFRFVSPTVTGGSIFANWQENGSNAAGFGTAITGTGGATNGFDPTASNNASLFGYNNSQSGNGWFAVANTNSTNLVAGVPYRMLVRGDRTVNLASNSSAPTNTTLRATGTLKIGTVNITDLTATDELFSLVGNPYQAAIDMNQILSTGSNRLNTNFYYVWDPMINTRGAYVTVDVVNNSNNALGSVANRYAQPGQAFFVKTVAGAGAPSLTIQEADKHVTDGANGFFRLNQDATSSRIRMTLFEANALANNESAADGFVINFSDSYSNGLDEFDAKKPGNQDENASMLVDEAYLSYQSRALPTADDVIALSHTQYRNTNYVYQADVTDIAGATAYLHDKQTNTFHELVNNERTLIPFTVSTSNEGEIAADRFEIVFQTLSTVETGTNSSVAVYPNPNNGERFLVNLPTDANYSVRITNMLGQEFQTKVNQLGTQIEVIPNSPLSAGIYTVSVVNGNTTISKKLIIK